MSAFHLYVTSLIDARWERRTGIPRVEYELARDAIRRGGKLITFSYLARGFVEVTPDAVESLVDLQDRNLDEVLDADCGQPGLLAKAAARVATRLALTSGTMGGARLLAMATPALPPASRRRLAEDMGLFRDATSSIKYLTALARRRQAPIWSAAQFKRVSFNSGDTIVIPGIIWNPIPLHLLARLSRSPGVRIAPYIHDLIPLRHPEFFTDGTGIARFRRFIESVLRCSALAFANSKFVAEDVQRYLRETGLRQIPVHPVPLCANLVRETPATETPRLRDLRLEPGRYALFVSTFSPRKNQIGAYRLWKRLFEVLGDDLPPLVLAGQRGWRSEDVFAQMAADTSMWGRFIHYVEAPTDGELAQLYRGCGFTIFPSFYEGWGLPITESLEFGKPCIAADNTSLPEAGQGLALHASSSDIDTWVALALRLIGNEDERAAIAGRIADGYRRRTWQHVGDEIHGLVAETLIAAAKDAASDAPRIEAAIAHATGNQG